MNFSWEREPGQTATGPGLDPACTCPLFTGQDVGPENKPRSHYFSPTPQSSVRGQKAYPSLRVLGVPLCIPHPWPCMLPQLSPSQRGHLCGIVARWQWTGPPLPSLREVRMRAVPSPYGSALPLKDLEATPTCTVLQLPFEPVFNLALLRTGLKEGRCSGTCVLITSFPWGQETVSMSACQQDPWTRAPTLQGPPGAPRSPAASLPGSLSVHCSSRVLQGTKDAPACHSGTWA